MGQSRAEQRWRCHPLNRSLNHGCSFETFETDVSNRQTNGTELGGSFKSRTNAVHHHTNFKGSRCCSRGLAVTKRLRFVPRNACVFRRRRLRLRRRLMLMRTPHQSLLARQTNSKAADRVMEPAAVGGRPFCLPPLSIKSPTPKLTPQRFPHADEPL